MQTKCERVRQKLLTAILQGRWQAREQLPPLPALAALLEATPGTTERALQRLIQQGILDRRPKTGTFVRARTDDVHARHAPMVLLGYGPESFTDLYVGPILREICAQMPGRNWVFLHEQDTAEYLYALHSVGASSVIAMIPTRRDVRALEALAAADIQVLCIGARIKSPRIHAISVDNARGMNDALRYLARLGHRRVGYLSASVEMVDHIERVQAFRRCRSRYDLARDPDLVIWERPAGETPAWVREVLDRLLGVPHPPTALVLGGGVFNLYVLDELRRRGIRVPDDISLLAFDDMPFAEHFEVPITVIRQPLATIGTLAVQAIAHLARPVHKPIQAILPLELVVRQSCASPRQG